MKPQVEIEVKIFGGPFDGGHTILKLGLGKWNDVKDKVAKWEWEGHTYRITKTGNEYVLNAHWK